MRFLLCIFFLAGNAATGDNGNYYVIQMPAESSHRTLDKQFRVFWNVPTMQCKSKGIPFEHLFERYGILQNEKDSFRGEKISILYDPGLFPALLKNESSGEYKFRNGGVPQEGNLEKHIASFKSTLEQSIPDPHFSGVGIIDFESWRPVFRQNFGVLVPYKDVSYQIERKKHWIWPEPWIKAEAKQRFEESARTFMQSTLSTARQMRPRAQWGYYGFPYCFNMAAGNTRERCANQVPAENDDIYWLWLESTSLYPSVYCLNSLTTNQLAQMVRGRIQEAARVRKSGTSILPYFWFKYHNTNGGFLREADLQIAIKTIYKSEASGFIIWGSSNDVNTVEKCKNLLQYVEKKLGPEVAKYTKYDRTQSNNYEDITATASYYENEVFSNTVSTSTIIDGSFSSPVTVSTTTDRKFYSFVTAPPNSGKDTTLDEIDFHKTSKFRNQADFEYYDDNSEQQNATAIKDVATQLDPEYFWLQPKNYTDNIIQQVEDAIRSKSFKENINFNDKTTTESILGNTFELDPPLIQQTTNFRKQEDELDKILIQSTTENELIDSMIQQTPNFGSQEDELDKILIQSTTENEFMDDMVRQTPNFSSQEDELDKLLIQSTTEDEFMNSITTFTEKTSSYNYNIDNYESIDILYDEIEKSTKVNTNRPHEEKQTNFESLYGRFGGEFENYEVGSQLEDQLGEDQGPCDKTERISDTDTENERGDVTPNIFDKQIKSDIKTKRIPKTVMQAVIPKTIENNSTLTQNNDTVEKNAPFESTTAASLPTFFDLYPESKYVIPIQKYVESAEGPPVIPLSNPESNAKTMESKSATDLPPINSSVTEIGHTSSYFKEKSTTEIYNTEKNYRKVNQFSNFKFSTENYANNDFHTVIVNKSLNYTKKHDTNTTPTYNFIFLRRSLYTDYDDTTIGPNVELTTILSINRNSTSDHQNVETIEKQIEEKKTNTESITVSESIIQNSIKDKEITSRTKDEQNISSTRTTTAAIDATTENPEREDWNVPILSNQMSGSGAHRGSGFRYYYCIIFYFFTVSKCLCEYYGQCS